MNANLVSNLPQTHPAQQPVEDTHGEPAYSCTCAKVIILVVSMLAIVAAAFLIAAGFGAAFSGAMIGWTLLPKLAALTGLSIKAMGYTYLAAGAALTIGGLIGLSIVDDTTSNAPQTPSGSAG